MVLVQGLPMESATSCALRKVKSGVGWSTDSYLLAYIFDAVREGTFANIQVRTKKKLKPLERLAVPGVETEKKETVNSFVRMAQQQFAKSRS